MASKVLKDLGGGSKGIQKRLSSPTPTKDEELVEINDFDTGSGFFAEGASKGMLWDGQSFKDQPQPMKATNPAFREMQDKGAKASATRINNRYQEALSRFGDVFNASNHQSSIDFQIE